PAPLDPKPVGFTPNDAPGQLHPFYALFGSMQHDFFLIEGEDPKVLSSLFEATPFFKSVRADLSPSVLETLAMTDTKRFSDERIFLDKYLTRTTTRQDRAGTSGILDEDDLMFRRLEPIWWNWRSVISLVDRSLAPAELAKRSQPRVLAAFDGDHGPFVVERRVGAGRIVLFTSGVTSDWNLLRGSAAMYMFHRTFCQLMEGTLPTRNYIAGQKMTLPVERRSDIRYWLTRPSGVKEPLNVDVIGANISGVTIRRPVLAGTYRVTSEQTDTTLPDSASNRLDEISLAVNGSENESNLSAISVADLQQKLGHDDVRILAADEPIRLEGGARRGQDLWKLCGWCVLGCLMLEMMVLAGPMLRKKTLVAQ
ncbi:MAG: hypothetical protein WCH39_15490, partial [Schlesneria sp.]